MHAYKGSMLRKSALFGLQIITCFILGFCYESKAFAIINQILCLSLTLANSRLSHALDRNTD